jgi:HK97 family phage portal protein
MYGTAQIGAFFQRLFRPRASGTARPSKWLVDWVRGDEADSGIAMTVDKAISYAAVFQAISVLAGDVGQLPVDLYRRSDDRNREKDRKHAAWRVTRRRANPYMSAGTFRETMMFYTLVHGNGVAEIEWTAGRKPRYLWPLLPHRTKREIDDNNNLWYVTRIGQEPGAQEVRLRPENVVHISNFGPDGTWGYPTITLARNSWGLGLAGEKYANRYFRNNGTPSGTLEHPGVLDDEAYARLRRDWRKTHEGLDNTARLAILEEGAKYNPIAFSQKDSQWLESREFQREEVASWFNLPPHKLGVLKDANYSNMVEAERHYLSTGLMRWLVKWQDEYDEKLLGKSEKDNDSHYFEFNTEALLRADIKTRYEAYSIALGGHPFMEINEVRGRDNMNAVEGGDEIPEPLNMSTGQEAGEKAESGEGKAEEDQVTAKIEELLRCEANRVCHAAKSAKNFVGWLDAFYSRWLDSWIEALPGDVPESHKVAIVAWLTRHKDECLEAAGNAVGKDELSASVAAATGMWPARAADYFDQLKGKDQ